MAIPVHYDSLEHWVLRQIISSIDSDKGFGKLEIVCTGKSDCNCMWTKLFWIGVETTFQKSFTRFLFVCLSDLPGVSFSFPDLRRQIPRIQRFLENLAALSLSLPTPPPPPPPLPRPSFNVLIGTYRKEFTCLLIESPYKITEMSECSCVCRSNSH